MEISSCFPVGERKACIRGPLGGRDGARHFTLVPLRRAPYPNWNSSLPDRSTGEQTGNANAKSILLTNGRDEKS